MIVVKALQKPVVDPASQELLLGLLLVHGLMGRGDFRLIQLAVAVLVVALDDLLFLRGQVPGGGRRGKEVSRGWEGAVSWARTIPPRNSVAEKTIVDRRGTFMGNKFLSCQTKRHCIGKTAPRMPRFHAPGQTISADVPGHLFSEQAIRELNQLDKLTQLVIVEPISSLKPADLLKPRGAPRTVSPGRKGLLPAPGGRLPILFRSPG